MGATDTSPKALRELAQKLLDCRRSIVSDCKTLQDACEDLKSSLDEGTYSRISGVLSEIAPHVQDAVKNAGTLSSNMVQYADKVQKIQDAAGG